MAKLFRRRKVKGISDAELDKVMKSKTVKDGVNAKAKAVQDFTKSISPVFGDKPPHRAAPAHGQPGDYRDSIIVQDISDDAGAAARVKPTDFKAKWIEFGNAHMPEYAVFAKVKARFRK
jgi:hypothetical protein